jgi:hypothetical protein
MRPLFRIGSGGSKPRARRRRSEEGWWRRRIRFQRFSGKDLRRAGLQHQNMHKGLQYVLLIGIGNASNQSCSDANTDVRGQSLVQPFWFK